MRHGIPFVSEEKECRVALIAVHMGTNECSRQARKMWQIVAMMQYTDMRLIVALPVSA